MNISLKTEGDPDTFDSSGEHVGYYTERHKLASRDVSISGGHSHTGLRVVQSIGTGSRVEATKARDRVEQGFGL